jgi:hypothetical protein
MDFRNILLFSTVGGIASYKLLGKYLIDPESFMTIEQRLSKYGLK